MCWGDSQMCLDAIQMCQRAPRCNREPPQSLKAGHAPPPPPNMPEHPTQCVWDHPQMCPGVPRCARDPPI